MLGYDNFLACVQYFRFPRERSKNGKKSKEIKLEVVGGRVGRRGKPPKRKANLKHPINH